MTSWLKLLLALAILAAAAALTWWLRPPTPGGNTVEVFPSSRGVRLVPMAPNRDAGAPAERAVPEPSRLSEALCPPGMAWVQGDYCAAGYENDQGCRVETLPIGVCVDLYEYPNQAGVLPASMATFAEAEQACAAEGKRLCRDPEWTLACRGTAALGECWFGRGGPRPDIDRLYRPSTRSEELRRVDRRRPSAPSGCVSRAGVLDLPGNVAEWVRAEGSGDYEGALKGGHFNKGSIGCERSIFTREIANRSPFVGFRCCREPLVAPPRPTSSAF